MNTVHTLCSQIRAVLIFQDKIRTVLKFQDKIGEEEDEKRTPVGKGKRNGKEKNVDRIERKEEDGIKKKDEKADIETEKEEEKLSTL